VVPVVPQDADSSEVLLIGYANEEALQTSLREQHRGAVVHLAQ
jgi:phosphoribosyl-AMP cyclohydrolase